MRKKNKNLQFFTRFWVLVSWFHLLRGLQIPGAKFQIPKPWIPDYTSINKTKTFCPGFKNLDFLMWGEIKLTVPLKIILTNGWSEDYFTKGHKQNYPCFTPVAPFCFDLTYNKSSWRLVSSIDTVCKHYKGIYWRGHMKLSSDHCYWSEWLLFTFMTTFFFLKIIMDTNYITNAWRQISLVI